MPTKLVLLIAASFGVPTLARAAADVAYQFELQVSTSNVDSDSIKVGSIGLQDRTWATPGVEQATLPLGPAKQFDFATACPRPHNLFGDGPYWLDDVCYPLTRELFHTCELPRPYFGPVLCERMSIRGQERPSPFDL